MKKYFTPLVPAALALFIFTTPAQAQWCVPSTAIPYSQDMPGITNVKLGTINRTSQAIENYPNNSYVNTGVATTLQAGQTYTVSITHTKDAVIFPTTRNNVRIWIDYDKNGSFLETNERALSANYVTPGTSTFTFTIPASVAAVSDTRMRITVKMSDDAGHTFPSPCDVPADPIGYHGEIEDYTVNITAATGIAPTPTLLTGVSLWPNPATDQATLNYTLEAASPVQVELVALNGTRTHTLFSGTQQEGTHALPISLHELAMPKGIYIVRVSTSQGFASVKLAVME